MLQNTLARARQARKNEGGFTLIELLIVIVILGVLAGIVVFSVTGLTDRGKVSACKADVATITTAGEAFIAKDPTGTPATDMDALKAAGLIHSVPTTVTYAPSGTTFTAKGATGSACAGYEV